MQINDQTDARPPATATLTGVRPVSDAVPTGVITRLCGAVACGPKHPGSAPLTVALRVPAAFADAAVAWALNGDTLEDETAMRLTVPAAALPTNGAPAVITASITSGETTGVASLTVPINAAPRCTAPAGESCLTVTPGTAGTVFPTAEFLAVAAGFVDDADASELTFEFGVVVDGVSRALLIDRANTFTFAGLPAGEHTLYVRAVDAQGAAVQATVPVTVAVPAAGFSPVAAIGAVDVQQIVSTRDPAAVSQAARTLAALAAVPAANASETAALQRAVDEKGQVVLLASSRGLNEWDPEGVQTTAASAADVVKVMANVSLEAKQAAVAIGDAREFVCGHAGAGGWVWRAAMGEGEHEGSEYSATT